METSHFLGYSEECHSSESGWTMYIVSPVHSDINEGDEDGENDYYTVEPGDDSDDSMASDASSGQIHRGNLWENGKGSSPAMTEYERQEVQSDRKKGSEKTTKLQVEKNRYKAKKKEKKEPVFSAKEANVGIESTVKARKNGWFGKRK
ncbi:hypothetical protein NMG60_11005828 [Bertholletia excelsa]